MARCLKMTKKSLIQHCERSYLKLPKNGPIWRVFRKPEACGQTVFPDMSVLIGQKLVENAKNENHFYGMLWLEMTRFSKHCEWFFVVCFFGCLTPKVDLLLFSVIFLRPLLQWSYHSSSVSPHLRKLPSVFLLSALGKMFVFVGAASAAASFFLHPLLLSTHADKFTDRLSCVF